jgi:hypothetical protein
VTRLRVPDPAERNDLGAFVARVVRLEQTATVRLQAGGGTVTAWASTPFDVLATRAVHGSLEPADTTVPAAELLTALTVVRGEAVDPGTGGRWAGELPPDEGWAPVDTVPAEELQRLSERGLALAREHAGPHGPPAALLDQTVLTVTGEGRPPVKVPLRCLFALSGMGFLDASADVRVSATGSWLRLDATHGAVVRRRLTALPLVSA